MHRRTALFHALAFGAMALLLACNDQYGEGPIIGIIYGAITTASGSPVAGAIVKVVDLDRPTCSTAVPIAGDSATTNGSGAYRLQTWSFGGGKDPFSYPMCAVLSVHIPAELGLRDTSVNVGYRMYFGPPDSTAVNVQLVP